MLKQSADVAELYQQWHPSLNQISCSDSQAIQQERLEKRYAGMLVTASDQAAA
jgi:hypothetical protein